MKDKIIEYLTGKDRANISEIYNLFPDCNKPQVRSTLNAMVTKQVIKRLERGNYSHI